MEYSRELPSCIYIALVVLTDNTIKSNQVTSSPQFFQQNPRTVDRVMAGDDGGAGAGGGGGDARGDGGDARGGDSDGGGVAGGDSDNGGCAGADSADGDEGGVDGDAGDGVSGGEYAGGGYGRGAGGCGGDGNRVFIEVPSPVTRCEALRSQSRQDADLAHTGTDLTPEYVVCNGGLAAAVAVSSCARFGTVPVRSPAVVVVAAVVVAEVVAAAVVVAAVVVAAVVVAVATVAWLAPRGKITYVAGYCLRAHALHAAADGCAV